MHPLPASLHNRPERIAPAVADLAPRLLARGSAVALGYADCGSYGALDELCASLGIGRLRGLHCYDVLGGAERVRALLAREPGTYLLTDYLVRSFERTVLAGLGLDRHPQLWTDYFGHYRRLVWLAQERDAESGAPGGRYRGPFWPAAARHRCRDQRPGARACRPARQRRPLVAVRIDRARSVAGATAVPGVTGRWPPALVQLLRRPRYEVMPAAATEQAVLAWVPREVTVTVTASPVKGLEPTLALTERLAAHGYQVVPHLSARLVRDRAHLADITSGCGPPEFATYSSRRATPTRLLASMTAR